MRAKKRVYHFNAQKKYRQITMYFDTKRVFCQPLPPSTHQQEHQIIHHAHGHFQASFNTWKENVFQTNSKYPLIYPQKNIIKIIPKFGLTMIQLKKRNPQGTIKVHLLRKIITMLTNVLSPKNKSNLRLKACLCIVALIRTLEICLLIRSYRHNPW